MLLELQINNFALIEEVKINFNNGFNVLCGETGSGKSILIDAINFVLGGKFSKNLIRSGENKTVVRAVFMIRDDSVKKQLESMGIEADEYLIISRETFKYGKTIARINNTPLNLSKLNELTQNILDIHGQHHNIELLDSKNHINYLDHYGDEAFRELKSKYGGKYNEYVELKLTYKKYLEEAMNVNKRIEFLKFQIEDIEKVQLKTNEDIELNEQYSVISNSEKIKTVLTRSYTMLNGSGYGEGSIIDDLNNIINELNSLEGMYPKIKEVRDNINDAYYSIDESIRELKSQSEDIYYDKNELDWINERLYIIDSCKKKYGETIEEILQYQEDISKEFEELSNRDDEIDKIKEKITLYEDELRTYADELSIQRIKFGEMLSQKVNHELKFVGLEKSNFGFDLNKKSDLGANGWDDIEFKISTNPGEPMSPLGAIVSGGELSRIMLALKSVFIHKDKVFSVIFDEIDTGISGKIAQRVGEKMYSISKNHQVFCVTHLPQIAAIADHIYQVKKDVINEKTYTSIALLDESGKIEEIAKMSGGDNITETIMEHAKEMISLADDKKMN